LAVIISSTLKPHMSVPSLSRTNSVENPMPQRAVPCYPYYSYSWVSLSHEYSLTLGTTCKVYLITLGYVDLLSACTFELK